MQGHEIGLEGRELRLETALAALREAEERFRLAFEHAPIGVALVAPDGTWLQVNGALCRMLGYSADQMLALSFQAITHPDDLGLDVALVQKVLRGELASYELDKRYIHADGHPVWATLSVALVRDGAGLPLYFISQVLDITERKEREAELQRLADHDPLTGLHNRRSFTHELDRESLLCARHGTPATLLLLDLDGFKAINDTFGHACGDDVLCMVADRLRARGRRSDVAGRLGGDEFALLLVHATEAEARAVATALKAAIREISIGHPGSERSIRASVGIAPIGRDSTSDEVLDAADRAMYRDKHAARARAAEG
jgi:diguanylate cyclase (GGDEF)-like protein/PAS domain S-box-containing protein